MYVDSIQNSYTEAALLARRDLAEFVGKKMSNDVKSQIIEGLSSGVKPKDLLAEQKIADDTGDISIFEKTKLLIHQKLDSMMSDETKDKLAQEEMSKEALQKELDEIINIPMNNKIESLNVSNACSVILFEMRKQRS